MIDVQFNPEHLNDLFRDMSYSVDLVLNEVGYDAIFNYIQTSKGHELYYQGLRVQHGSTTSLITDGVLIPVGNWITVEKRKLP